jgi:hypothetical protein
MKTLQATLLILLAALLSGCVTAGRKTGRAGNVVLTASGVSPVLIPIGIAAWIPMTTTAAILYYPGCWLTGKETEKDPFGL